MTTTPSPNIKSKDDLDKIRERVQDEFVYPVGDALAAMQEEVRVWTEEKGWRPDPTRTFGDDVALLHSEASEALEAYRIKKTDRYIADPATFPYSELFSLPEGVPYPWHVQNAGMESERQMPIKPEGVPSEFADLLIRLLDCCAAYNVDLWAEYRAKMDYNWFRTFRHGGKHL